MLDMASGTVEPPAFAASTEAARVGAALLRAERQKVASELHGSSLQLLAAACLRLQTCGDGEAAVTQTLAMVTAELQQAMLELRSLMSRLASPQIERSVVVEALARLEIVDDFEPASLMTVDEAAGLLALAVLRYRA